MASPPSAAHAASLQPTSPRSAGGAGAARGRGSLDEPRRSVQTNRNAEWMSQVRGEKGEAFTQRRGTHAHPLGRTDLGIGRPPHTQRAPSRPPPPPTPHPAPRTHPRAQTVAWAFLSVILLLTWLAASAALGDAPGPAWTLVHLAHAAVSFYLLHWAKGSPVPADQGKYDALTFWEQVNRGREGQDREEEKEGGGGRREERGRAPGGLDVSLSAAP